MEIEDGKPNYKLWLVGDSNPSGWHDQLRFPLDSRHPTRHNIWTPILEQIQKHLYIQNKTRLDTNQIYVRNAIQSRNARPNSNARKWNINEEIVHFRRLFDKNNPALILTFGAFAFEFCRRALSEDPTLPFKAWTIQKLGQEFAQRNENHDQKLVPLLHAVIARGSTFLRAHREFSFESNDNYFHYAGTRIGRRLLECHANEPFWL